MGSPNLVASTTSSRRPRSALPTMTSDSPSEYTSAVSTRLMPASRAVWIMRTDSSWSVLPMAPKFIAPSANSLTEMPVPPRFLRFIGDGPFRREPAQHGSARAREDRPYRGSGRTPFTAAFGYGAALGWWDERAAECRATGVPAISPSEGYPGRRGSAFAARRAPRPRPAP